MRFGLFAVEDFGEERGVAKADVGFVGADEELVFCGAEHGGDALVVVGEDGGGARVIQVPEFYEVVLGASGGEGFAVGGEDELADGTSMRLQFAPPSAGGEVPEDDRSVHAARGQGQAIGGKGKLGDGTGVPEGGIFVGERQGLLCMTGSGIEQGNPMLGILLCNGEEVTVRGEGRGADPVGKCQRRV